MMAVFCGWWLLRWIEQPASGNIGSQHTTEVTKPPTNPPVIYQGSLFTAVIPPIYHHSVEGGPADTIAERAFFVSNTIPSRKIAVVIMPTDVSAITAYQPVITLKERAADFPLSSQEHTLLGQTGYVVAYETEVNNVWTGHWLYDGYAITVTISGRGALENLGQDFALFLSGFSWQSQPLVKPE